MNSISVQQIDKIILLYRGESIVLNGNDIGLEITDTNIKKIKEIVDTKNEYYKQNYNIPGKVLDFDKGAFILKAIDYFGFIELFGMIIKSVGDYLLEYKQKEFLIDESDIESIVKNFKNKITVVGYQNYGESVSPQKNGAYLLKATSYVGIISLPSGFRIQIIPKISNTALYYILCYLYDADIPIFDKSKFPQGSFFLDMIASIFKSELDKIIQQGLLKKYVLEEENQNFLKGKLLIDKQIKHNFINKHRFYCKYDELTYDNLENQTILYTLTLLINLVSNNLLKQELVDLKWILENEITPRNLIKVEYVEKISFSRLNDYYEKIINLSRQIISEIYIGDIHSKEVEAYGYLVDMNLVFQKFILKLIKDVLLQYEVKGQEIGINNLIQPVNKAPKIRIRPDILISKNKETKLTIDTKYKKLNYYNEIAKANSPDIYQIVSYSLAYKCNGMLIYPKGDGENIRYIYDFSDEFVDDILRNIFVFTVDISSNEELCENGFKEFINKTQEELRVEFEKPHIDIQYQE